MSALGRKQMFEDFTSRKFFALKLRKGKRRGTTLIGIDVVPD